MDFKIVKPEKDYNYWEIFLGEKQVGRIEIPHRWGSSGGKRLYLGDTEKEIASIQNQKEALEKLQKFFEENKQEISRYENLIQEVQNGISEVSSAYNKKVLETEYIKLEKEKEKLEQYDLV
ncbi:hypothetical protein CN495_07630 [Bacillus thuringiensis]|uniref:Uncharacterized protein n=1 Tax=Bacillus thuringiensis TaxID=1428 RepID=A0ABD6S732_BACTU|nr:hypothetical protein [Bacillus thuringiensis]PER55616.1 hypothetical protein CN495_07630 [Bacillus thuringiensis]